MLEFPADDTAGGDHEDALCEMSFHVPKESDRFGGEETTSAAEVRDSCTLPHQMLLDGLRTSRGRHVSSPTLLCNPAEPKSQQTICLRVTQVHVLKEHHFTVTCHDCHQVWWCAQLAEVV